MFTKGWNFVNRKVMVNSKHISSSWRTLASKISSIGVFLRVKILLNPLSQITVYWFCWIRLEVDLQLLWMLSTSDLERTVFRCLKRRFRTTPRFGIKSKSISSYISDFYKYLPNCSTNMQMILKYICRSVRTISMPLTELLTMNSSLFLM